MFASGGMLILVVAMIIVLYHSWRTAQEIRLHEYWTLAAIILFAHISLDRFLGHGLKFHDSFGHTHLGSNGKDKKANTTEPATGIN